MLTKQHGVYKVFEFGTQYTVGAHETLVSDVLRGLRLLKITLVCSQAIISKPLLCTPGPLAWTRPAAFAYVILISCFPE